MADIQERNRRNKKLILKRLAIGLLVFVGTVISPYVFVIINIFLNKCFGLFGLKIEKSEYIMYMGTVLMGALAVSISVAAFRLAKQSDLRDQRRISNKLNIVKNEVLQFIESNCFVAFEILRKTGENSEITLDEKFREKCTILRTHDLLEPEEYWFCLNIYNRIVQLENVKERVEQEKIATEIVGKVFTDDRTSPHYGNEMGQIIEKLKNMR